MSDRDVVEVDRCVAVWEDAGSRGPYLFGIFTTEEAAKAMYGTPSPDVTVTFDPLPLFGFDDGE